ncbi:PepSY domain-containing protein [Acinetobacter qingfengensis]|uniref:Uncharacterized protein n=1 Tax=Acinetobacter qingfengensis TaxID=1262585 RepID=A0A1E7REV2_9GAMM|nr:PepSY-associated TM helix domain-containing protein [Acinetobacter qingfengensis]KAA8735667.1 PepSY domain-containing protein [Acinetobacter qingfengensis]OEY97888.1 hypothetical protein BJI46_07405 [Acinetobacter qingfengensis]
MKEGFRQSMAWLHTWSGLIVGWVLFFVFLTGTMGYIRDEITRWMQPEKPLIQQSIPTAATQLNLGYNWLNQHPEAAQAERWGINFMTPARGHEDLNVSWTDPAEEGKSYGKYHRIILDPQTGQEFKQVQTPRETGGGNSLYMMHYALHYVPYNIGILIVGACTMLMFVAIISGVITHKKIFKDFFTFRPAKGQRSWLDAHNVISVIALPFYIMITYSGLIFFYSTYMPLGLPMTYGQGEENAKKFYQAAYPEYYPNAGHEDVKAVALKSVLPNEKQLQGLYQQVQGYWGQHQISRVDIQAATQYSPVKVKFFPVEGQVLSRVAPSISYSVNGQNIQLLTENIKPLERSFTDVVLGLHEGEYANAFLRWMYVITGFLGTAMIATGLVLWTVKRRPKQIKNGKMTFGHALVERLNIGMIAGLPLGITVYFWANRLLPVQMENRANWEMNALFLSILLAFLYGWLRPIAKAWYELLFLIAITLLLLPILNAITTNHHILTTWVYGDWALFSMDLGFVLVGLLFLWMAYAVWRKRHGILKAQVKKSKPQSAQKSQQLNSDNPNDVESE